VRKPPRPRVQLTCIVCGALYMRVPSQIERGNSGFCSRKCFFVRPDIMTAEERFWSKISKTESCWSWTGTIMKHGYGMLSIGGKFRLAHRYSWELFNGHIPDGLYALHHCDNPLCVRPDHLFIGTQKDNIMDMMAKGRHRSQKCKSASSILSL